MSDISNQEECQTEQKSKIPGFDEYNDMDRITIPNYEKNLGTEAFIKGDYFEATRHYAKAIMAYQFLVKDGVIHEPEEIQKITQEIYFPCNLNLSLCYIKQKEYKLGLDFANKALQVEPNNIKALYRRGICQMNLQEFKAAGDDFKSILTQDPDNNDALQAWDTLVKKKEQAKQKQKAMSEKMLSSLDYQDQIKEQQQQSEQNIGWFKRQWNFIKSVLFCERKKQKKQ